MRKRLKGSFVNEKMVLLVLLQKSIFFWVTFEPLGYIFNPMFEFVHI